MSEELKQIISLTSDKVMTVELHLTDICNFNCTYCFPGSTEGKYRYHKDFDNLLFNLRALFDHFQKKYKKNKFQLVLCGGGEPTLYPNFKKLCTSIKQTHNVEIRVVTNGSRTLRWWQENLENLEDICLSCHNEEVDIDHYIDVADLLYKNNKLLSAMVMVDGHNWNRCVKNIEKMLGNSKYPWLIEAKEVFNDYVYTQEQKEYLDNSLKRIPDSNYLLDHIENYNQYYSLAIYDDYSSEPMKINDYTEPNFFNWKCSVGTSLIIINASGRIKSGCNVFTLSENFYSKKFKEELNKIDFLNKKCPVNKCLSTKHYHISKRKT